MNFGILCRNGIFQVIVEFSPTKGQQAAAGFEPANNGFANRRLRPLGYAASVKFGAEFTAV